MTIANDKDQAQSPQQNTENQLPVSAEMEQIILDGQRLLSYIAKDGDAQLNPELTQTIIDGKLSLNAGKWTAIEENRFLLNYDKLAKTVYPVTVESINAIIPSSYNKKRELTTAERAVAWYRRYTMVALILMLIAQLYWMLGNQLRVNLGEMFEQREATKEMSIKVASDEKQSKYIEEQLQVQDQQFDANYKLLMKWNKVWLVGGEFKEQLPSYFTAKYLYNKKILDEAPQTNKAELNKLELDRKLHEVRIVYFENILSADFVLNAFQGYLLPLLYGLLGSFIFVLRSLMREIKALTYTFDNEIRYRLRLTLGALGGMIVGWFLKPEEAGALASLSPMALAFLMGYNVDVLFSIMDKIIDNIKHSIDKPADKAAPAKDGS
jgi:hypothetical protein